MKSLNTGRVKSLESRNKMIIVLERRLCAYQREERAIKRKLCNKQVPKTKKHKLHYRLGYIMHVYLPQTKREIAKLYRHKL